MHGFEGVVCMHAWLHVIPVGTTVWLLRACMAAFSIH